MTDQRDEAARAASEVRHRTANIFQLLGALARMRSQKAADAEAKRQLLWMADAVGSLGALERHRQGEGVNFGAYLDEMGPIWRRRHGVQASEVLVAAEPLVAPDSGASTLALIAQELVGNALAHGYAGRSPGLVRIRFGLCEAGRCELMVSDDGDGFDPALAPDRFGLWFVRSLSAQVRGDFTLESRGGVTARLTFPHAS